MGAKGGSEFNVLLLSIIEERGERERPGYLFPQKGKVEMCQDQKDTKQNKRPVRESTSVIISKLQALSPLITQKRVKVRRK
jgi:hypothetical protein